MHLKQKYDLTYLFISHDIGVIEHISDRVIVIFSRIVETALIETFVEKPNHLHKSPTRWGARLEIGKGIMNLLVVKFLLRLSRPLDVTSIRVANLLRNHVKLLSPACLKLRPVIFPPVTLTLLKNDLQFTSD